MAAIRPSATPGTAMRPATPVPATTAAEPWRASTRGTTRSNTRYDAAITAGNTTTATTNICM